MHIPSSYNLWSWSCAEWYCQWWISLAMNGKLVILMGGIRNLICETQSSDKGDSMDKSAMMASTDPSRPWYADLKNYIDTLEAKSPLGMSTVQWWGLSIIFNLNSSIYYRSIWPSVVFQCSRLLTDNGIISFKQMSILARWYYNQQTP